MNREVNDRKRGALLGLAVSDALGAAVEFMPPGTFEPVTGYRGGGPHGLSGGEWTDDTSMALALADSIAHDWDLDDQARRYVSWWRKGEYSVNGRCFDIGNTVRFALSRFERTGDAHTSADPSEGASGNGSIMRLASVPIRYANSFPDQLETLIKYCAESSLPTHASPQCLSACAYFGLVLAGLINGHDRDEVLDPDWEPLSRLQQVYPLHPKVAKVALGSFREKRPPAIVGSGYVIASLEAALWAFHDAKDFRQAVLQAVNLGDDADTTGARLRTTGGCLLGRVWDSGRVARRAGEEGDDREGNRGIAGTAGFAGDPELHGNRRPCFSMSTE